MAYDWIQDVAAVLLVFLSGATLVVLRRFTAFTKTIAENSVQQINVSVQQTENAQKPFLALVIRTLGERGDKWIIENQGFGPALNIRHSDTRGQDLMVDMQPLAKGEFHVLNIFDHDMIKKKGFNIEYDSLGRIGYVTSVDWREDGMRSY